MIMDSTSARLKREFSEEDWRALLSSEKVVEQLLDCMNLSEMDKRQFREVARVLVDLQGYPGAKNPTGKSRHQAVYFLMFFQNMIPTIYSLPNPGGKYSTGNSR